MGAEELGVMSVERDEEKGEGGGGTEAVSEEAGQEAHIGSCSTRERKIPLSSPETSSLTRQTSLAKKIGFV